MKEIQAIFSNNHNLTPEEKQEIEKQVKMVEKEIQQKYTKLPETENELTANFTDKPRINHGD